MLQQMQVDRFTNKFTAFIKRFPDIGTLASSPLEPVMRMWPGLGYNRRVPALREAAKIIVRYYGDIVPDDPDILVKLPGIGPATAASIAAFAYNQPTLFLETNIHTAIIHHFFYGREGVEDAVLLPVVAATLDRRHSRKWYSTLMDYCAILKKTSATFLGTARHIKNSRRL